MNDLAKKNTTFSTELEDLAQAIIDQHGFEFKKALAQMTHFYNVTLDEGNFDVKKDIYVGKLMYLHEMSTEGNDDLVANTNDVARWSLESDVWCFWPIQVFYFL